MIKKINHLKKFGCFDDFKWTDDLPPFNKTNILYGYNGSGKTTLSNMFYLLSKECINRVEFAKEYLIDGSGFQIETENGFFSESNFDNYDKTPIYVFNTKFIIDHIYDGSMSRMSSFSSGSSGITNDAIDKIDERIKILESRSNQLKTWMMRLEQKLNNIWTAQKNEFNDKIKGKRLTDSPSIKEYSLSNIKKERYELETLYREAEKLDDFESFQETISLIKEKVEKLTICIVEKEKFKKTLNLIIKVDATEKLKSHISNIAKKTDNDDIKVGKWFIDGNFLLKSNKKEHNFICPLCLSNIEILMDDLISGYDKIYNDKVKELYELLENYEKELNSTPNQIKEQENVVNELSVLLKQFDYSIKNIISNDKKGLNDSLRGIHKLINDKRANPSLKIDFNDSLFLEIENFNRSVTAIKKEINEYIEEQEKRFKSLQERDIIYEIKKKAKEVSIAKYNDKSNSILVNSKKSNSEIAKKNRSFI